MWYLGFLNFVFFGVYDFCGFWGYEILHFSRIMVSMIFGVVGSCPLWRLWFLWSLGF
jgi:hypothetical protein